MRVRIGRFGEVDYESALRRQEALVAEVGGGREDAFLVLEHPRVYTLGRGADAVHLGAAADGPIPVVRTTRGGQVTYHGPGQLVGYPIFDLRRHRPDVRWYVHRLEEILIRALAAFGIAGERMPGAPGVWTGGRKIASIGIAIRRWVTWHGFALNVHPDLEPFERITPCGLAGVRMTSVALEGGPAARGPVEAAVMGELLAGFGFHAVTSLGDGGVAVAEEARS